MGRDLDLTGARRLLDAIVARWKPHQVWLFGSRARGTARPESDWDFLVVVPDETPDAEFDPSVAWKVRRDANVPADIVLTSRSEFEEYRSVTCTLQYEAAHFGVLVHGQLKDDIVKVEAALGEVVRRLGVDLAWPNTPATKPGPIR